MLISTTFMFINTVQASEVNTQIEYSEYFASSGFNTPKHLILEVYREDYNASNFGPYAVLINTSGVEVGSVGNTGSTLHDVTVYSYVYDDNENKFNCFYNITGTGVAETFKLEEDNREYSMQFHEVYYMNPLFRMYFKKSWNDTWSGTLSGTFDPFVIG
jgi:hypothetical protein